MDENNEQPSLPEETGGPNWAFVPGAQSSGEPAAALPPGGWQEPDPGSWQVPAGSPTAAHDPHYARKAVAIGVALALVAGFTGAALSRLVWPASSTSNSSALPPGGGGSSFFGGQGKDNDNGAQGTSSSAQVQAVTSKVSPALVDINTTLGYDSAQAAGTGIVLSSGGLILTNNHVINGATTISATDLGNGKTYTASVVGYDRSHDIAVLQLQGASGLSVASFGNSKNAAVGASVIGIGNAGGTGGTPSAAQGTITALNQSITASDESSGTSEKLTGLIQTNAAIEPGDSGGPLVTLDSKVIGVDTAASSSYSFSTDGSEGYTIPINTALGVAHQITGGKASATIHLGQTGFLGVRVSSAASSGTSLSPFGNSGTSGASGASGVSGTSGSQATTPGAYVESTVSGSPAAAAGLVSGDTITAVNGHTITSPDGLSSQLSGYHPGDKVSISWTDSAGATHTATVTLAKGPAA